MERTYPIKIVTYICHVEKFRYTRFELKKKSFMLRVVWYGKPFIGAVHAPINKTIKSVTRIVDNSRVTSNLFECSVNGKHMHGKQISNIPMVNTFHIYIYHASNTYIMRNTMVPILKSYNLLMFKFQLELNKSHKVLTRERAEVKDFIFSLKT